MRPMLFVCFIVSLWIPAAGTPASSQSGGDNLYQDPNRRFTVHLASGWTASPLDQNTVQFAGDGAFATVFVLRGSGTAEEFVSLLASQYSQKWKELRKLKSGQATLGGVPGIAAAYSGINPDGALSSLRIVAAVRADRGYGLLIFAPQERLRAAMPALDLLESSLAPEGQAPSGAAALGLGTSIQSQARTSTPAIAGIPRGGIPLQLKQAGYCSALAPADWAIVNVSPNSNAVDLSNGALGASWMVTGFSPAQIMYYPQQSSPEGVLQSITAVSGDPYPPRFSAPQALGNGYVAREFENARFRGVVIYIVYPQAMGGFIWSSRTAYGPKEMWQAYGPLAVAVALTVRCTVQLQVSPGSAGPRSPGASREESTYNRQLGTEYAHDPVTGENFLMSHAADYQENGPQGAGYYRKVGDEYHKLEPGRID